MTKRYILAGIAGVMVGLLLPALFGAENGGIFGGRYNNVQNDFSAGITVDGTVVIDGDGNVDAPITSTTGTFTSTLSITGDVTVNTSDFFIDVSANEIGVGTTSPAQGFHIEQEGLGGSIATTTLAISSASTTPSVGGQVILEDTDGAGCTAIYALNGSVIGEAVTCPTGI